MPNRSFFDHCNQSTTPRRSQRLLHLQRHQSHKSTSEPQHPNTPRRPQYPKPFTSKSSKNEACSLIPSRLPQGFQDSAKKSSHKSAESRSKSRNCVDGSIGLRRSPRLNNGVYGFPCLRRSPRLSNQHVAVNDYPRKGTKKSSNSGDSENLAPESRKSTRVYGRVQGLSTRQNAGLERSKREKSLQRIASDSNVYVHQVGARKAKTKEISLGASVGNCEKMIRDVSVIHEGLVVEGREGKERNGDMIKVGVKRKRKRGEGGGGEEIAKGWTKEQELALQRAYFSAKPSPHFWKKVSKLVPGKSQQDCFDRIHCDHLTPPQSQRRSRAKIIKSSPLQQFSISASKLLKPTDKKVRRSNFLKPKSYFTQKYVEKLLQHHPEVDQGREGDIFSVLEPNTDFSTNAFQPSDALSTPKQLKENQGLLQSCTETSSSSHKKSLSRFSSSCIADLVSPPVLKKVKNRALHEKYINQLRCREARRRAASARLQIPVTGKIIGEGSSIQKRDVVKAAKVALVCEARNAINKFQQSQVIFTGITSSSDEDNDDGIGVESADKEAECERESIGFPRTN